MTQAELDRRVRQRRFAKETFDPGRAHGWLVEEERGPDSRRRPTVTVFLAGAECPFRCVYCDLWRFTLGGATPPGALPAQLRQALEEVQANLPREAWGQASLKLYNASNFFDDRAVPEQDLDALAALAAPFRRLVVECHPRLLGDACWRFATRLLSESATQLEVAMGLETVHPDVLPKLGKKMTLAHFDEAAAQLRARGIALRAFVLLGVPFLKPQDFVPWTVRSVEHALGQGAEQVAVIPLRPGNGFMEDLQQEGQFTVPTLAQLEEAMDLCLDLPGGAVSADLWDLERFSGCAPCLEPRRQRLQRLNLRGVSEPRHRCGSCAGGAGS